MAKYLSLEDRVALAEATLEEGKSFKEAIDAIRKEIGMPPLYSMIHEIDYLAKILAEKGHARAKSFHELRSTR